MTSNTSNSELEEYWSPSYSLGLSLFYYLLNNILQKQNKITSH